MVCKPKNIKRHAVKELLRPLALFTHFRSYPCQYIQGTTVNNFLYILPELLYTYTNKYEYTCITFLFSPKLTYTSGSVY